jgi:hypothetical protein
VIVKVGALGQGAGYSHFPIIAQMAGIVVTSPTSARVAPTAFRFSPSRSAKRRAIPAPRKARVTTINASSGRLSLISFTIDKSLSSPRRSTEGMPRFRYRPQRPERGWPPALGFYEAADFVKTTWNINSFYFDSFWPTSDNTSPLWLWCLIFAMRGFPSAAMINAKVSDCFQRAT